jgi:predicted acylesterase/phospholipase RssA
MGESGHFDKGFDFGSGTSAGAINIAGVAMFPPERFAEGAAYVADMWRTKIQKTSDVWSLRFPLGIPGLWNPSVGTSKAEEKLLNGVVNIDAIVESKMKLRLAAVDMETGKLVLYSVTDLVRHGIKPILASSSYPLAFPPVTIEDEWLSDGGLRDTAPLGAAIDAGCDDIVVLTTRDPYVMEPKPRSEMSNVFTFGIHALSIQMHEVLNSDIRVCQLHNHWSRLEQVLRAQGVAEGVIEDVLAEMEPKKKVDLTVLYPLKPLGTSLEFKGEVMKRQIEQGYEDARQQLG